MPSSLGPAQHSLPSQLIPSQLTHSRQYHSQHQSQHHSVEKGKAGKRLEELRRVREERQARPQNEDSVFGNMVAIMLQKLPPHKNCEAKFKIHKLLFEIEAHQAQQNTEL